MISKEHLETTAKVHDQQLHRRVDLLLRTGKVLVESMADSNRIVRNMKRTAAYLGIPEDKLHINVSFTMLMGALTMGNWRLGYLKLEASAPYASKAMLHLTNVVKQ